jgi:hypothetical protein
VTYVVDGLGEFHSLGDALQAAIIHPEGGGQPTLALQKAKPSAPLATAPATDDTLTTVLLVGVAALVAYLVYDAVKQDDKAEADAADDEDEEEDEDEDEEDE